MQIYYILDKQFLFEKSVFKREKEDKIINSQGMANNTALIIPRLINEKLFIKVKFHYNKVNSHNRGKRHIMNLVLGEPMDMEMVRLPVYNKAHIACETKRIPHDKASITGTMSQLYILFLCRYHRYKMYEKKKITI